MLRRVQRPRSGADENCHFLYQEGDREMKVAKQKIIRLTKKEATALMTGLELAVRHCGAPECPKVAKSFFSAIEKLDKAFKFGIYQ
jgi:uncharacterized FAD-dependent dehydrogenase